MSVFTMSILLLIIAIGTYFQTVTGFGLAMIVIGVVLLNYLSTQATSILEFMLGAIIVYSGISFALNPKQKKQSLV